MTSGDWLPAQAPFDVVRRGYSPEQVTAHLERLEYDLRITTANRDATNQRLNELGSQLAAAQAEADTLRAQLDRNALEPVSMANLSDRMQRMIRLAEEEAGEIRARAEADADRMRGKLETSLSEASAARAAFDSEREHTRKQLAEQVHGLIAEATSEALDTTTQAQEEAARLLQEANAEADRTVSAAKAHAEMEKAQAREEAELMVREATAAAETLTSQTKAERERLDAESLAHRTQVDEDFEIAIADRRREAHKVITDREAETAAAAKKLIAEATSHSQDLVAAATGESERLMQQATTYSEALVNRAAAESHQRVRDADDAVLALHALRDQLGEQLRSLTGHLDHIRELAASAPALITPPADEQDRPVAEDFPADPTARPTPVDLPVPVYGEPIALDDGRAETRNGGSPGITDQEPAAGTDHNEHVNGDTVTIAAITDDAPAATDEVTAPKVATSGSQRTRTRGGR